MTTTTTKGGFTKTSWSPRSTECDCCGTRTTITYDVTGQEICSACVISAYIHGHNFDSNSEATRAAVDDMSSPTTTEETP